MIRTAPLVVAVLCAGPAPVQSSADCVVLLHGLGRTSRSMAELAETFDDHGYRVANVDYPSRTRRVEELAGLAVGRGLSECGARRAESIHFVTHSLGGILVRYYLAHRPLANLGRVVMLAPPNQGSEVVDHLRHLPGFSLLGGPAASQLGTDAASIPSTLGPVTYPVGVIAGTRTINPLLSAYLPNPDDGKVSVQRAKVQGMADFVAVRASHPFLVRNKGAIRQALAFIATGAFVRGRP